MERIAQWNWNTSTKEIPLSSWQDRFEWVEEPQASPDGESVAAIVKVGENEFNACVNGETWPEGFDKMWYLRHSPDGRLTAIVSKDGEWTVAVDGAAWETDSGMSGTRSSVRMAAMWPWRFSRTWPMEWRAMTPRGSRPFPT